MTFTSYNVMALIDDYGIGGQGLNGTNLIGVKRQHADLNEALELLLSLRHNPMTTMLQLIGVTEGSDDINLYIHGFNGIDLPDGNDDLKSQIADALSATEVPTGYRVAYTDRHDDVVERRCRFFATEAEVRKFADEYYDLQNSFYGINRGFCRPESLPVAVGPRAWDMTLCSYEQNWEVSYPEECYLDAFTITDPHIDQFQYSNIRRTHCMSVEANDDGTISIPVDLLR